jgi:hypothetical protein
MPTEVKKYTCDFKCGARAVGDKGRMSAHENGCWSNPKNKTCKTCDNEHYQKDSDGMGGVWYERGCLHSAMDDMLIRVNDILQYQNSIHIRPIYNCKYHNQDADENIEQFANEVEAEIRAEKEGTEHYPYFNKPRKEIKADEFDKVFPSDLTTLTNTK